MPSDAHTLVIFGATGDLARRKLLPAYFQVLTEAIPGTEFQLIGVGRQDLTEQQFREHVSAALEDAGIDHESAEEWCIKCVHYHNSAEGFEALSDKIDEIDRSGNRVFYLALPPRVFPDAIEGLGKAGLAQSTGWTRLVIEKPFGTDLESAEALNKLVHSYFDESQVYRIDHYLGKETVQNLLVFRFANALFESSWNRDRVEKVQITVAESLGIETRAGYYDKAGAIKDMVQSHLTQVMTLVAMEPPAAFDAHSIREEKVKVLQSIKEIRPHEVVLGQYGPGDIDDGEVLGYHEEKDVPGDSTTATAAALVVNIDNWRWQGVPFLLRTGKRFPRRLTQIVVSFRKPPVSLFESETHACQVHSNRLVITLQPDEGFELLFDVKKPGEPLELQTKPLDFHYKDAFGDLPGAYETLLLDVVDGDQTLFVRADEVEESWRLYAPLADADISVYPYPAGTWGPRELYQQLGPAAASWVVR